MSVSVFYPDAHVETTSVDGQVTETTDAVWATIRAAAGDTAAPSDAFIEIDLVTHGSTSPQYTTFSRGIFLFDTNSLPNGATISAVTFGIVGDSVSAPKLDQYAESASISMVTSTPASNTDLVAGDYAQLGTTKQATDLTIAGFTDDQSTYNDFTLNATGRGNINKTGITKFGIRITFDNDNSEPTWAADKHARVSPLTAEEAVAGDKRPKLTVTYTVARFHSPVMI